MDMNSPMIPNCWIAEPKINDLVNGMEILDIDIHMTYPLGDKPVLYTIEAQVDPEGCGNVVLLQSENCEILDNILPFVVRMFADRFPKNSKEVE